MRQIRPTGIMEDEEGETIIEKIESEDLKNVRYFLNYIDSQLYKDYLKKASALFSEIVIDYRNAGIEEKYGESKDSGISYLMLEYLVPCFLNSDFNNLQGLEVATILFDNFTQLQTSFDSFIRSETMQNDMKKALEINRERYFDPYIIAANIKNMLQDNSRDKTISFQ